MLENLSQDMGIRMTSISKIEKEIKEQYALDCHKRLGTALSAKFSRKASAHHVDARTDDQGKLGTQLLLKEKKLHK